MLILTLSDFGQMQADFHFTQDTELQGKHITSFINCMQN
jgi:hypothetical protein